MGGVELEQRTNLGERNVKPCERGGIWWARFDLVSVKRIILNNQVEVGA